jgi:hypothetical protein
MPRLRARRLPLLLVLAGAPLALHAWADTSPPDDPLRVHAARRLDDEGKLSDALPLYAVRARQTVTQADRLRYAAALLRAGRSAEARAVFDQLVAEEGSMEHGDGARLHTPAVCASAALAAGFPAVAVAYARTAVDRDPRDAGTRLLLVRALAASGDAPGARPILRALTAEAAGLRDGPRIELARWHLATGDARAADRLLARKVPESVGQMFQDSVQANTLLQRRDWAKAAGLLAASERKVPKGLDAATVDRAWRNAQRELRWVRLRRAVALWRQGHRTESRAEASKARASDEAYVRSAAVLLLATDDLAAGRRPEAVAGLEMLAGRDHRFAEPVQRVRALLADGGEPGDAVAGLRAALAAQDRSADPVTIPLLEAFAESVRP